MRGSTGEASGTGARGTKRTPSAYRSRTAAATATASRVLPVPAGPVSVSSRPAGSSRATAATSASRPTRLVR